MGKGLAAMTAFDELLAWRESSTTAEAISAALQVGGAPLRDARNIVGSSERIVLTGAGSSYYLAQTAAAVARASLRRAVAAVPLSELILRPEGILAADPAKPEPIVIISRSGSTSEAVAVAQRMRALGHPTLAVTCRALSPLAAGTDVALVSPAGDEAAIVMTRSFASMLAILLNVVAGVANGSRLSGDLRELAGRWSEAVAAAAVGRRLGSTSWSRIVILGGGPSLGIAHEWALKLTETSQIPAQAFEPFEFRHGPVSVCEPGMLVVGLVGGHGALEEVTVVEEAGRLGAATWLIAREQREADATTGDVSLIGAGLDPVARLPLLLHAGHALAFSVAVTRGRDPDFPRHLGQVVVLGTRWQKTP